MNLAPKYAIGLMSGTSCDGIDAALLRTDGVNILSRGPNSFLPFTLAEQEEIRAVMKNVAACEGKNARLTAAMKVEDLITAKHIEAVEKFFSSFDLNAEDVDVIGFHGQTMFHDPDEFYSIQIGDGAALAKALGIPVVYDFRSEDMRMGGQGAPLVPVYHRALVRQAEMELPVAIVNIGGVANVTYVVGTQDINNNDGGDMLAFDTGPGNALLNDWVEKHTGEKMDFSGRYASAGTVNDEIVNRFLSQDYFEVTPPKSLDRNSFEIPDFDGLSLEDGAATLTEITVRSIAHAMKFMDSLPRQWIVVGGGALNDEMVHRLECILDMELTNSKNIGWDADFMEAEAFGFLAVRHLAQLPISFPSTTGVKKSSCGGLLVSN